MSSIDHFIHRLCLTVDYCELNHESTLAFRPLKSLSVIRENYFIDRHNFAFQVEDQRKQFLESHLKQKPWTFQNHDALSKGRLLIYEPDCTLLEGASARESQGFFDDYDCPPIDTWIDFFDVSNYFFEQSSVVSWIPEKYIPLAERGVGVSSTECIYWLDKSSAPFATILREHGILK